MLSVNSLQKSYKAQAGPIAVLKSVSLDLETGTSLALTGESGSGKSTLLHLIAGLDTPDAGTIRLSLKGRAPLVLSQQSEKDRAHMRKTQMGIIFQQFNLIPSLTNWHNLTFAARMADRFDSEWCRALADRLGLSKTLERYPDQISGGQQQRLAVARAFAARPSLILADEPTGNLDEDNSDRVLDLAFDLVRDTATTLVIATHSAKVAQRADRQLHLAHGILT